MNVVGMAERQKLLGLARGLLLAPNRRAPASWADMPWAEYLKARGYLSRSYEAAPQESQEAALAVMSAALTFPMTIAAFLRGRPQPPGGGPVRIAVLGARAEAQLPEHLWREVSELLSAVDLELVFVGPSASEGMASPRTSHAGSRLSREWMPGLFHETVLGRALLDQASAVERCHATNAFHAYVAFNPGVGHPDWQEAWRPTMRAVLGTGAPLLLTALSSFDADQDSEFWRRMYVCMCVCVL